MAGRAAERAEELSRDYAEQALRYRHLFVVAGRWWSRGPRAAAGAGQPGRGAGRVGQPGAERPSLRPPQGPIRLVAEVQGGRVVVAVEDDGVEVTAERRERIFDEQGSGATAG